MGGKRGVGGDPKEWVFFGNSVLSVMLLVSRGGNFEGGGGGGGGVWGKKEKGKGGEV